MAYRKSSKKTSSSKTSSSKTSTNKTSSSKSKAPVVSSKLQSEAKQAVAKGYVKSESDYIGAVNRGLATAKNISKNSGGKVSYKNSYDSNDSVNSDTPVYTPDTNPGNVNNVPAIDAPTIGNQPKLDLAPAPLSQANDYNSFVGSVGATTSQQTQFDTEAKVAQEKVDQEERKLNKITDNFDLSSEYAKLQKKQGIPDLTKKLQEGNLMLTQMQNEYQLQNNTLEGQAIPEPFVIGQQNELAKTASIKIGAQAAIVQALQGNLELAEHYVDKIIDLEYKDFTVKYEAQKYNLEAAKGVLTKAEAKQAKILDFQLDMKRADYTTFLSTKKETLSNMLLNGASSAQIQAASISNDMETLLSAAGRYAVDPVAQSALATDRLQRANIQSQIDERNRIIDTQSGSDLSTIIANNKIGQGTKTKLADILGVINASEDLASARANGKFKGFYPGASLINAITPDAFKRKETIENEGYLDAINLKVQQWASGASLTSDQIKQVNKITPKKGDTDKGIKTKLNSLVNFMNTQARSQLQSEGIDYSPAKVDMFTNVNLLDEASQEQLRLLKAEGLI
jgi:hypothetical protein